MDGEAMAVERASAPAQREIFLSLVRVLVIVSNDWHKSNPT